MKVDIYMSQRRQWKMLSVPSGTVVTQIPFPANFDPDLSPAVLQLFRKDHELTPGLPYFAMDAQSIVSDIQANGYAVHSVKFTFELG